MTQRTERKKANEKLYPRDKWPDNPDIKDGDFFLNSAKVIASGIFKSDTALRRAIKELVKYGFIVCIVPGKTGRREYLDELRQKGKNFPNCWKRF